MSVAQPPRDPASDGLSDDATSIVARTKRSNLRLLVLVVAFGSLIAIPTYLYWSMVHDAQTTKRIQAELNRDGIQLIFSQSDPKEASLSPFQSVISTVRIQGSTGKVTDKHLPTIRDIHQDLTLILCDCPITDAGLATLEGRRNIRWLELRKTQVTNEGVQHLRGMGLESLDLSSTKISDAGLAALGEVDLPHLTTLGLEMDDISDKGIMHLARFKALEFLSVAGTKVTKDGQRRLRAKVPGLTILGGT